MLGEGFLGHTVAIEQFQHWKNAGMDPRIHFFASIGMDIKSLFCIPIYGDHNVKGVYFGAPIIKNLLNKIHGNMLTLNLQSSASSSQQNVKGRSSESLDGIIYIQRDL